jgi:hypothetical protein
MKDEEFPSWVMNASSEKAGKNGTDVHLLEKMAAVEELLLRDISKENVVVYRGRRVNALRTATEALRKEEALEDKVAESIGYERCEFGPDGDECEECGSAYVQLFFGDKDYFSGDGRYMCMKCIRARVDANNESFPGSEDIQEILEWEKEENRKW